IEADPEPVEFLFKEKGEKALLELEGVGKGIAHKIGQFLSKGKVDEYEDLKHRIPRGLVELLNVPGLGPKKAARLYHELKITSLAQLEQAARSGKIRKLPGFKEKSEEDILMGLELIKKGTERKLLGIILPHARALEETISKMDGVVAVVIAGSLRRRRETVKDIDLLVFTKKEQEVAKALEGLEALDTIERQGTSLVSGRLKIGLNVDMRILPPHLMGSGMVHFTGSKAHGIALRNRAIKMGMKFSEYGLMKGKKIVASQKEEEVYRALQLEYIPPEMRENEGEIDMAAQGKLPTLIGYGDLKGDLHTHTNWSDGVHSTEQMVQRAIAIGHEYYAITDHSYSDTVANGLDEKRLKHHIKEIHALQTKYPQIHLLTGSEVHIDNAGKLDYSQKMLKELDIVIASVHSSFKMDPKQMTKRLMNALTNEYVTFIAHPTGRLINQRNPYSFDLDRVLEAAKENGKAMEINSFPSRLDFDYTHIRECVKRGVKLVINSDAHSVL
ncbi:MAG: DNA polymerase/3'-5' exonuclease PolX, partial [archaeon]|nr:DNA polymerase/3'-5' exonuclease PolX [archaeon]